MPDPVPPLPTPTPVAPPSSPTPPAEPARFADAPGVPPYLRGKTLDEALPVIQQMEAAIAQSYTQLTPQPAPQPAATAPAVAAGPPDPDLIYNDKAEYNRQLREWVNTQASTMLLQGATPIFASQADTARTLSQIDPTLSEVWRNYGPEIDRHMQGVPSHQRTKAAYDLVAKMVRGEHVEELAQARAQTLAATMTPGLERPGTAVPGGTPSTSGDAIDALFAENHASIKHFQEAGMTAAKVREHYARMALSPAQAADLIKNSRTLSSDRPIATSR